MAAVHEDQAKRRRRTRYISGNRNGNKICSACEKKTRWLSVDGLCWDCTVTSAKNKIPIHIDSLDEDQEDYGKYPGLTSGW